MKVEQVTEAMTTDHVALTHPKHSTFSEIDQKLDDASFSQVKKEEKKLKMKH
jgi:hypothetical protein